MRGDAEKLSSRKRNLAASIFDPKKFGSYIYCPIANIKHGVKYSENIAIA